MAKIGEGHAEAWVRAGFKEIAQALEAFPGQGVHHVEEPGLFGHPTAQIVTQEMGGLEGFNQQLDAAAARASREPEQDKGRER